MSMIPVFPLDPPMTAVPGLPYGFIGAVSARYRDVYRHMFSITSSAPTSGVWFRHEGKSWRPVTTHHRVTIGKAGLTPRDQCDRSPIYMGASRAGDLISSMASCFTQRLEPHVLLVEKQTLLDRSVGTDLPRTSPSTVQKVES